MPGSSARTPRLEAHLVVAPCRGSRARRSSPPPSARPRPAACAISGRAERGRQRIAILVQRAGLQRRQDVLAHELLAHVEDVRADRAERQRPLAHVGELAPLAEVERHGDRPRRRTARPASGSRPTCRAPPSRRGRYVPCCLLTRFTHRPSQLAASNDRAPRLVAAADHQDRVVAADRPDDFRQPRPVDRYRPAAAPAPDSVRSTTSCSTTSNLRSEPSTARRSTAAGVGGHGGRAGGRPPIGAIGGGLDQPEIPDVPRQRRLRHLDAPRLEQLPQLLLAVTARRSTSSRMSDCRLVFISYAARRLSIHDVCIHCKLCHYKLLTRRSCTVCISIRSDE